MNLKTLSFPKTQSDHKQKLCLLYMIVIIDKNVNIGEEKQLVLDIK